MNPLNHVAIIMDGNGRWGLKNKKLQINLALNYGSKFELLNAFKELKKNRKTINEKNIEKYL